MPRMLAPPPPGLAAAPQAAAAPPPAPPPPPPLADTPEQIARTLAPTQGLDPDYVLSIMQVESSLNPQVKPSSAGAVGLMQLMPATAAKWKVNAADPYENVLGGVQELRALSDAHQGDLELMARRYNASRNAPPELTDDYAYKVLTEYERRKGLVPGSLTAHIKRPGPGVAAGGPAEPPPPPPPHARTLWERMTGTTSTVPADVQAQLDAIKAGRETGGDVVLGNLAGAYHTVKHAYNPTTREGRRNLASTGAAMAAAPVIAAATPAAIAGGALGALYGIGGGALASGAGGVLAETAEQLAERVRGERASLDPGEIGSAGGEQAAQDVLGHVALAPVRLGLRATLGPGIAREVSAGMKAERNQVWNVFQDALDSLQAQARDLRLRFSQATDARLVAKEAAVAEAQRRATAALARGEAATTRSVGAAEDLGRQEVADITARGADATQQAALEHQAAIGPPPSETAAGTAAAQTLAGPAKAEVRALGQAVEAAKRSGPVQDISAPRVREGVQLPSIQDEARRLAAEIQSPIRAMPPRLPRTAPAPAAFDPQLDLAMTAEELREVASHPVMRTIRRLVNSPNRLSFADLANFETELGSKVDFKSPIANKIEGARKHLWTIVREQLGTHQPYDDAATVYAAARRNLTTGYAGKAAKVADLEPAYIVQQINAKQPRQTARLMALLAQHGSATANAVRDAWLHSNILQGGIEGLGQRLQVLRDAPEFARNLLGERLPATLRTYGAIADGWQALQASAREAVTSTEAAAAERLAAARARAGARMTRIGEAGRRTVEATEQTATAAQRSAAATHKVTMKQLQDEMAANRIGRRGATQISEQEALAMRYAREPAQQILNGVFGATVPTTFRGAIGLVRMLTGPRSADVLQIAANRPEVSKALVAWLADPNTRVSYQVVKRLIGQGVEEYGARPAMEAFRRSNVAQHPPTIGGTPAFTVTPPPPPPRQTSEISLTITKPKPAN